MRRSSWWFGAWLAVAGCVDGGPELESTRGMVDGLRGEARVGDELVRGSERVAGGARVRTGHGGRARLRLDGGALCVMDADTELVVDTDTGLELRRGRLFVEAPPGEPTTLELQQGTLRFSDAQLIVEPGATSSVVHVLRGRVAHRHGTTRGVAEEGRRLTLEANGARVAPDGLVDDFTGGLAAPGPRDPRRAQGVGELEGRRPGDSSDAPWPLVVRTLDVRVRIVGELAITDVEQIFFNPSSETLEGAYRIRVPEGAVLHRFAVDRDGRMVDGFVREKRVAAAAYEAQVYEGSTLDPALLEWDAPGTYRARIHPIVAGESRKIAIRYSSLLERTPDRGRRFRFPMRRDARNPAIEAATLAVDLDATAFESIRASHGARLTTDGLRLVADDFRPHADFVVDLDPVDDRAHALRAAHGRPLTDPTAPRRTEVESDYVAIPITLDDATDARPTGLDLVVVADLSAATDRSRLELGRTVIEAIAAQLGPNDRLAILGGDLRLRTLAQGAALGAAEDARVHALLDALSRATPGGASDVGAVLSEAAALLDPARRSAVVYVGDALPTVGELGAGPLVERLARLPHPPRILGVAVGEAANVELLAAITGDERGVVRVGTRAEAAEAAMDLVAFASRPRLERATVELGNGIERILPRGTFDVPLGETFWVLGRVRGALPSSAKVRGMLDGRAVERSIPLVFDRLEEGDDLRLRWGTERLEQLLLDGARRTEVVDLGVRAGLITPFTSIYVPSAAELASLGDDGAALLRRGALAAAPRVEVRGASMLEVLATPFAALYGCARSEPDAAPPAPSPMPAGAAMETAQEPESMERAREEGADEARAQRAEDWQMARQQAQQAGEAVAAAPAGAEPTPPPESSPRRTVARRPASRAAQPVDDTARGPLAGLVRGSGTESDGEDARNAPQRGIGTIGTGYGGGGSSTRDTDGDRAIAGALLDDPYDGGGSSVASRGGRIVRTVTTITVHARARCSDASRLVLESRAGLFRERLAASSDPSEWARAFERAVAQCEVKTPRDRRTFLDLVLDRAGDVGTMTQAYWTFTSASARSYLRRAIFRRVRTPDELRIVRNSFGSSSVDAALVDAELARATDDAGRVTVLRRLISRFDGDLPLSMRLLELLERLDRKADALALAITIRQNPLADAAMRTAIGEMFLRMGDEAEARRTFSEIVEFAPRDELARRRLGDLYRAHGWFDDAYRQYETLATIRPDDGTVLLLLAQAAAGAGRIDEALRLEQRLVETAPSGGASGLARTAVLFSSARLAELRATARAANDATKLRAYLAAMRRGGVAREASPLRATLMFAHPDADLALYGAHPGLGLSRPTDTSPELGLEAFDVREREDGTYRVEVRRGTRDALTRVDAKLVVVMREGAPDEKVFVLPLRFDRAAAVRTFEIVGDQVRELPGGAR